MMRSNIKVLEGVQPKSIAGDTTVEKLVTNKEELKVDGVFIMRQSDPVENLLPGLELDGEVIKVNRDMSTNLPGAKATGEGLVAVLSAISYLDKAARVEQK